MRAFEKIKKGRPAESLRPVKSSPGSVNRDGSHRLVNQGIQIGDQATVECEPYGDRKKALRHAVGHVNAKRLAPFGDDVPVPYDNTRHIPADLEMPCRLAKWFAAKGTSLRDLHITGRG